MVYQYDDRVCFKTGDFKLYIFLLICIFTFVLYILSKKSEEMTNVDLFSNLSQKQLIEKVINLQDSLYKVELQKQNCERELQQKQTNNVNDKVYDKTYINKSLNNNLQDISSVFLNKINNPIVPPENLYRDKYDAYQKYQQIGFLTNLKNGQFPIFARDKYPNRSDKQEYYTINEGRNHVKIPFKTKNNNELFDGDEVIVPELSNDHFIFKKYETEGMRYDPNK